MKILNIFKHSKNPKLIFHYCEFTFINRPKNGDIVERKMESGKTGVFRIENIDRPSDPGDQYFYDELFLGYREENKKLPSTTRKPHGFMI